LTKITARKTQIDHAAERRFFIASTRRKVAMPENNDRERKQWHLDKTVSVTHLISTIIGITTIAIFLSKQDTRITVLEQSTVVAQKDASDFKTNVRQDLRDISVKLDRLIERVK
jgi:hypothetical protein